MANIAAGKAKLRKQVADALKQLDPDTIKRQSDIISRKLIRHEKFRGASRVSIYLSTATEVSTLHILGAIFESGKQCYVPRFDSSKSQMEMVRLNSMTDYETLPTTKWNIKQPKLKEDREDALKSNIPLDLVILPGVAFTSSGWRLGHGKGYYDSFLTQHKNTFGTFPHMIALALKEQIFADIPISDRDVILNEVLTAE